MLCLVDTLRETPRRRRRFKYVAGDADGNIEISPCCALKPVSSSTQLRPPPSPRGVVAGVHDNHRREARCPHAGGESLGAAQACNVCRWHSRPTKKRRLVFFRSTGRSRALARIVYASLRCLRLGTYELYSWGGGGTLLVLGMPSPRFPPRFFPPFEAAVHRSELGVPKSTS